MFSRLTCLEKEFSWSRNGALFRTEKGPSVCSLVRFRMFFWGFGHNTLNNGRYFSSLASRSSLRALDAPCSKLRLQRRARLCCPLSKPHSCSQHRVPTSARGPHKTVQHAQRPNCSQKKNARTLQEQEQTPKLEQFDCRFLCAVQSEVWTAKH